MWDAWRCKATVRNLTEHALKIFKTGWWIRNSHGEWEELVPGQSVPELERVAEVLPPRGSLAIDSLVPSEAARAGARWFCLAAGEGGTVVATEEILDPDCQPARWRKTKNVENFKAEGGGRGIGVVHRRLCLEQVSEVEGARRLCGHIGRDYGCEVIDAYSTKVVNLADQDMKIVWFQSYEELKEGGVRGRNVTGRMLGPNDFLRWFGGAVDEDGWIEAGGSVTCDLNWRIPEEGRAKPMNWVCAGIDRRGDVWFGEGELEEGEALRIRDLRWDYRADGAGRGE
jgi:hypothetical protein